LSIKIAPAESAWYGTCIGFVARRRLATLAARWQGAFYTEGMIPRFRMMAVTVTPGAGAQFDLRSNTRVSEVNGNCMQPFSSSSPADVERRISAGQ